MGLQIGQKLGPYEVLSAAGAGGMGEVYKAKDTRLDRIVAIKILPERMRNLPQLVARFEQEARAISRLNHPNICTLHDIGHENGTHFLVMEFLEGESLSEGLKRGALPAMEALDIAALIADALSSAHRKGLVHRDLKPGNIMLTREGPKLLDFGLAKLEREGGLVEGISGVTHTTPLTGQGTIIGTIQYMSPEQLEGREADERSDIFSFGATVYEMITGQKAFEGRSQASLIAAILEKEPVSITQLKPMTPPGLERLVRKCLAKEPDSRWQSASDLSDELRWISQSGSQAGLPLSVTVKRKVRLRTAWVMAIVFLLTTALFAGLWLGRSDEPPQLTKFTIGEERFVSIWSPAISPDGRHIAFLAEDTTGTRGIWIRTIDRLEPRLIAGTEDARMPIWSPDSKSIAFGVNSSELMRVNVGGGPIQSVAKGQGIADGSWGSGNIILFDGVSGDSIRQVSAGGGPVTAATTIDREDGEFYHAWPWFLPDGKHFLYLAVKDTSATNGSYTLKVTKLGETTSEALFEVDSRTIYADPGYLIYMKSNVLTARRFDVSSLKVLSDPIPIEDSVIIDPRIGRANFSASANGRIVYETGGVSLSSEIVWIDRSGRELDTIMTGGYYFDVDLSPDNLSMAVTVNDASVSAGDIWIYDFRRDVATRLTFHPEDESSPVWDPGNDYLYYAFGTFPSISPMKRRVDGTDEPMSPSSFFDGKKGWISDVSGDGKFACVNLIAQTGADIYLLSLEGDQTPELFCGGDFDEYDGVISPNGRFLAYSSDESGSEEIYVREIGRTSGKWQVSRSGGSSVRWSHAGDELFFINRLNEMWVVKVTTETNFSAGNPVRLFTADFIWSGDPRCIFDVDNSGNRFACTRRPGSKGHQRLTVVDNWYLALRD